jgi:hypothetical protein
MKPRVYEFVCVFRRQNMEADFLQRRIELLQSENQCNRDDIARLTGELASKVSATMTTLLI